MDLNYNKIFNILEFSMRMSLLHPEIPKNKLWLLKFATRHGVFTFVLYLVIYSTLFHDLKNKNYTQSCENLIVCIVYCIATFCYLMMMINQNSLSVLIQTMKIDYMAAMDLCTIEQKMLLGYAKRGNWNIKLWVAIACGAATTFPLRSISLMIYYAVRGEFKLIPVYELTYPMIFERNKDDLPCFFLMYAVMLWYCVYAASLYVCIMPLGPIFMLHTCGQLKLVNNRINDLFADSNDSETYKKLTHIIRHLQKIYGFVEHIQKSFRFIYEFSLKVVSLTLPLFVYELIETIKRGHFNIEFFILAIGCVVITGIPCYYGEILMEMGEHLRLAIYRSGWERHWNRRIRRTLLMLVMRTARPVAIRAMFHTMCLAALSEVIRHAYGIFNLINAAW